uniref:Uncharacterized protein n=1 Tax=Tanacetum cinerariifolium TaxID=118510 RepID=A0A6L2P0B6_TANCI|nr:hypothetical protein [Tanacetum cinerariifolium]
MLHALPYTLGFLSSAHGHHIEFNKNSPFRIYLVSAGEKKTVKKASQSSRGVSVGLKIAFKPNMNIDLLPKSLLLVLVVIRRKVWNLLLSNTLIGEKIDKIERQICEGKLRLLDDEGNPLVSTSIVESDSEVEVVVIETANLSISMSDNDGSDKSYGTNSLLKQWRDSYTDNDDYDSYDDDMYENHDFNEHLQSICDDLDIMVRGRKKK